MENTLPFNPPAWKKHAEIAIRLTLGVMLGLLVVWALSSLSVQPTAPVQQTLSEQLSEVYQAKLDQRLIKSDLLVRQAGLNAQIQKANADLDSVNKTLLDLNQKEIDLSMKAVTSLETMTSTD